MCDASASVPQPDTNTVWDPGKEVPVLDVYLSSLIQSAVNRNNSNAEQLFDLESRTDLDSHANMPVVGKGAFVLATHDRTCQVSPYTPDYKPMSVPMVDAAVKYECPYDGRVYILIIRNALLVPAMDHNLLPPFMLREAGILLKDVPKIQVEDPSEEDHAITFSETGFRIPLSLWGTFSYFPTTKPTKDDLVDPSEVYMLTPSRWNPHSDAYAKNEEAMLDWEGNITAAKDRQVKVMLDVLEDDEAMVSSMAVTPEENAHIDAVFADDSECLDESSSGSGLFELIQQRAATGDFMMSIGSTNAADNGPYLVSDDDHSVDGSDAEEDWDELDGDFDMVFASSASQAAPGVSPEHLAKVWRISHDDAK